MTGSDSSDYQTSGENGPKRLAAEEVTTSAARMAEEILDQLDSSDGEGRRSMTINFHRIRISVMLFAVAALAAGLLALLSPKPAWTASRTFQSAPNSPIAVGSAPTTVTDADFNADGKMDLAAQNSGSTSVSVRLGNGDGTFQAKPDVTVGSSPTSVIGAELNADGKTDLAVTNYGSNSVSVLRSNGDGTFQTKQDFPVGGGPTSVINTDFNRDGYPDLAVANYSSNSVSVLLGQDSNGDGKADGTFVSAGNFSIDLPCGGFCIPATAGPNQVIVGNFNGDSNVDLATANIGSCGFFCTPGGVSVLLGNGNGTFQDAKLATSGAPIYSIDTNGSGDLFAANYNANAVTVYRSNGNGTFSAGQSLPVGTHPSAVTSEDLDGDGVEDLAVSNFDSDNVSVLWGSGGFQTAQNFAAGDGPAYVIGARLNADGFTDLAVANQNSNNVSVLLNTAVPPQTTITSGPSDSQVVNSTSATFGFTSSEPGSTFQCSLDDLNDSAYVPCTSPQTVPGVGLLAEGSHTFYVKATGASGTDPTPARRTWTVDTTAPAAPVISSPANNSFDTDGTITISGTAEANSTVSVFEATASGDTSKGTTQVDASGNWTKTISGVTNGSHAYEAKAKDAAENTSGFSNMRTVLVDKVKPQVSSTTPLARATKVGPSTNLTATFSEKMRTTSVNATTMKIYKVKSDGTQTQVTDVVVSLSSDGLKATLNPFGAKTTLLTRNTKYRGVLTTGAKDLAGNSLAQQKSWTFTTKP
jgi:hypothetical protein